jgi:chromosome segregation ATPase
MSDHEQKIFRGTLLGGFNRKDVMYFVEKSAEEYKEEMDTLREQLELMRSHRDELRHRLELSEKEKAGFSEKIAALESASEEDKHRIEQLSGEVIGLKEENARLSGDLLSSGASFEQLRVELAAAKSRYADLERLSAEFEKTKKHIADIELKAYERADRIEKEAMESSNAVMEEMKVIALKAAEKYAQVRTVSESTAVHINDELDQIREWLLSFGGLFSELDGIFDRLSLQPVPEKTVMQDEGLGDL